MSWWPFSSTRKKLTSAVDSQLEALKLQVDENTRLYYLVTGGSAPSVKDEPLSFLTYRGQVGAIAQTYGGGFSLGVKVDIAQIFLPYSPLRAEAGAQIAMKGGKHRLLIIERQADHASDPNPQPIAFMNMKGYFGELSLGISAAVGVGYDTKKDLPGAEMSAFSAELQASVEASAKYTGSYLRASDAAPKYFQTTQVAQLKTALSTALNAPRGEQVRAVPWDRDAYLSMWTHTGEAGVNYSASAQIGVIDREEVRHGAQAKIGAKAEGNIEGVLKAALFRFQSVSQPGVVTTQDTSMTFKRLGGKGIEFEVSAKVGWGKWDEKKDDEDEKEWKEKSVSERARSTDPEEGEGEVELGEDGPKIKVDKDGIEIAKGDIGGLGDRTTWSVVDAFSYTTAVWVWNKIEPLRPLAGSGYVRGHSVVARTLSWYYETYPPQPAPPPPTGGGRARRGAIVRLASSGTTDKKLRRIDSHIRGLARSLRVPLGYLIAFLDHHGPTLAPIFLAPIEKEKEEGRKKALAKSQGKKYVAPVEEESPVDESVIFEAAYSVDHRRLEAALRQKRLERFGRPIEEDELPDFGKMIEATLRSDEDHYGNLQAIRLRVQNHKEKISDKAIFSAGIKLKVVSLNFSIDLLDRFASGATRTVVQTWYGEDMRGSDPVKLPLGAVQPPILFF